MSSLAMAQREVEVARELTRLHEAAGYTSQALTVARYTMELKWLRARVTELESLIAASKGGEVA